MVEIDPITPLAEKNQAGGERDKSPPGAPKKHAGGHGRRTTSKDRPLTIQDVSKNKEGRTITDSTKRSRSHHRGESVAHSKSVHNNSDILNRKRQEIEEAARLIKKREYEIREMERIRDYPEDSGLSRRHSEREKGAMVKYRPAPSYRRSKSRSPSPRRKKASSRRRSRSPKERGFSPRKRRGRSRNSSTEEGTRKHHRDRYERPESDWDRARTHKSKEQEAGTMTAREAARKALSNIVTSPFTRRLQDARLPSRVKHGAFVLYETNADPVAHIQHYQQAMFWPSLVR